MRIVVIGGGIIGIASSYYLNRRGGDVTVVERGRVGTGNTGRANGGIRAQFSSPVNAALSKESIEVWESFEEQFGVDIGYRRPGYMFLAREESTAEQFEQNVTVQNELGVPSRYLTASEAESYCPELHCEDFIAATYSPTDGFADPHLSLQGFAENASEEGVDIRTQTEVTDILRNGRTVKGVKTETGTIRADYVVNAAGAWAKQIGEMAGLSLSISPRRRKLMVVDPETPVPESVPFVVDSDNGVHFRPEREGSAVAGGHFSDSDPEKDPDNFSTRTSIEWAATVIEKAADVADYFGPETKVQRGWAGLYAVTPDHHPIIEETVPGFVNAVGFSGHGFMHSPATGKLVSQIVFDDTTLVDISALTADRFENGVYLEEGTVID